MPSLLKLAIASTLLLSAASANPMELFKRTDPGPPCIPSSNNPIPSPMTFCQPLIIGEKSIKYRDDHLNHGNDDDCKGGLLGPILCPILGPILPRSTPNLQKRTFAGLFLNLFGKEIKHRKGRDKSFDGCIDNDDGTIELNSNVCVTLDGANAIVKFDKIPKYTYKDIHVYLGLTVPSFTQPAHLPYTLKNKHCKINHDGTATCTIPHTYACGSTIYFATHAEVQETGSNKEHTKENVWGKGHSINSQCSPSAQYTSFIRTCSQGQQGQWCPPADSRYCQLGAAFGYVAGKSEKLNDARWGWKQSFSFGELKAGLLVPMFTGAAKNDLTLPAVRNVGAVTLGIESGNKVKVAFRLKDGYDFQRLNYYVSCVNPDGGLADRPWDYGHDRKFLNEATPDVSHIDSVELTCLSGAGDAATVWIILYTDTYFYPPKTEECPAALL
ncbi:hypothetical protein BJ508DRAFT_416200 [Ascobolus immersus RN42]|uniref:Uncharacterized protein n=1 Tax=Ascobolus immersus RN42 TaxID=1160509 RepID=A0A3N4HYN5_ASCIM|nr:hypothetical protein BJ508DRAFT_416200 [Ascobolus immersus RN42]